MIDWLHIRVFCLDINAVFAFGNNVAATSVVAKNNFYVDFKKWFERFFSDEIFNELFGMSSYFERSNWALSGNLQLLQEINDVREGRGNMQKSNKK